jgi:ParB-like chromosome segregation protein Spo0J
VSDPIERVEWLPVTDVHPNAWNPNHVQRPELRLLERSLLLTGWVQPLLVSPHPVGGYLIVDGYHRWRLSCESPAVQARWGGLVPCAVLDLSVADAMLLTVRINRAKGSHGSVAMSTLVRSLVHVHGVPIEQVCEDMGATAAEVDLLLAEGVLKARKAEAWSYSKAWHPIEDGRKASDVARERAK